MMGIEWQDERNDGVAVTDEAGRPALLRIDDEIMIISSIFPETPEHGFRMGVKRRLANGVWSEESIATLPFMRDMPELLPDLDGGSIYVDPDGTVVSSWRAEPEEDEE